MSGAFLTSETGARSKSPSIFTLLASDSLSATTRPALDHLLRTLSESFPEQFAYLWRLSDEVHLIISSIIEHHFFKNFQSSFSENFYNLQRSFHRDVGVNKQVLRSMLTCVLLPYLKLKCDRLFEKFKTENRTSRWAKRFVAVYPFIHLTWEGTVMAFWFLYAVGRRGFHSPFNNLIGCTLVTAELGREPLHHSAENFVQRLKNSTIQSFATLLTTSLQYGAFILQFLDWWYANKPLDYEKLISQTIPPPNLPSPEGESHEEVFRCPLCQQQAKNETLLTTSGYVFCYRCIVESLNKDSSCPITGLPTSESQLVRVYPVDAIH